MKTNYNYKIAFYCRKLKKASLFEKCYSRDEVVYIVTKGEWRDKATNILHMNQLLELFSDFIFSDNRNSTGDSVFNAPLVKKLLKRLQKYFFCYSDINLRSSVKLFPCGVSFFFHLCRGKLINKRVIAQFHNKATIYIVPCLGVRGSIIFLIFSER